MNFLSTKEFFYKLNTIGFILLLLPVIVFLYLHAEVLKSFPAVSEASQQYVMLAVIGGLVVVDLTIVNLIWRFRIGQLRSESELSKKMDGYFVLTAIRNGAYAFGLLLLTIGYYFTHSIYFFGLFMVVILLQIAQWPGPARFCIAFALKGSERDLVLHNEDLPKERKTRK